MTQINKQLRSQNKRKLPIGIQTFSTIREQNSNGEDAYYYVDKTRHILELVEYHYIFLSRPRRFGKSLTLDTIAELFSGNRELFKGLYADTIEANWDWDTTYPIIRLGFAEGVMRSSEQLNKEIHDQLDAIEQIYQLDVPKDKDTQHRFRILIQTLAQKHNQKVVILIDEYDKPILDNLGNPDIALQMRDGLRNFYSVIKGQDANIRFAMLTGVSKFSKVNLFSGLNNLLDITIDRQFSNLCGYTQAELTDIFADELTGVNMDTLRDWYNGYNWTGEAVYNPFDILLFLRDGQYHPYWFETGTPTFLIDKMVSEGVESYRLDGQLAGDALLSAFDVGDISPIALMFQTGYLTIREVQLILDSPHYILDYPNREVRQSLNQALIQRYVGDVKAYQQAQLVPLLMSNDFDAIYDLLNAFFASIPHDWHRKNNIAHFEGYWASVFYAYFASLGLDIKVEDSTSRGRMDMVVDFNGHIYIFEFKVIEQAHKKVSKLREPNTNSAIEQIKSKQYADKYKLQGKPIHLIGIEFSEVEREIESFVVETV